MKLESLKSEKFEALAGNQMAKLYGGKVVETSYGGYIRIGGVEVEYKKDRETRDDDTNKLTKDEYYIKQGGEWCWYDQPVHG